MAEVAEAVRLLKALREEVAAVSDHGRALLSRLRAGQLRTDRGVSLLGARGGAMLLYVTDLALLLRAKSGGRSLGAEPALPRLLESRVVLEKLRPLEQRLRYQLDKLLRAAAGGAPGSHDPLHFRPNPSNLPQPADDADDDDDGGDEGSAAPKPPGRYVPPRLVPVPYAPSDAPPQAVHQRSLQAARRRALSSALLRELRDELGDGPELLGGPAPHREQQRTQLEESMMVRLSESRQQRAQRRLRAMGAISLDSITHFGDTSALLGPPDQEAPPPPKKKKKMVKRKAGKRKGFRRRR